MLQTRVYTSTFSTRMSDQKNQSFAYQQFKTFDINLRLAKCPLLMKVPSNRMTTGTELIADY